MENKKPDRKNIAEKYANEIIRRLQEGTAPWQKPWKAGEFISPFNAVKENRYRGVNVAILGMHGFADPRWMTFKQAQEKGWQVKKGSKSEQVLFWQWQDQQTLRDDNGNPVLDSDGKEVKETVDLARPRLYVYNVFHATQVQDKNGQDLPPFEAKEPDWNPHERAEAILRDSGAVITHDQLDRAFYRRSNDTIHLPPKGNFPDEGHYYATALHELCHWTGHESRMNRDMGTRGSDEYAREELRAEIASWMLCQELGLPHDPTQHTAYVETWVKNLKEDPYEIMRACQAAEKIKAKVFEMEHNVPKDTAVESLTMDGRVHELMDSQAHELNEKNQKYEVVAMRRTKSADGLKSPWVPAESDEVDFYAVLETASGNIVATCDTKETADMKAQARLDKIALPMVATEKTYLNVPFMEKSIVKSLGATWDSEAKGWCARPGVDLEPLGNWITLPDRGDLILKRLDLDSERGMIDGLKMAFENRSLVTLGYIVGALENPTPNIMPSDPELKSALRDNVKSIMTAKINGNWDTANKYCSDLGALIKEYETKHHTDINKSVDSRQASAQELATEKTYLAVPYKEKEAAKKLGAKWDRNAGLWYAPKGTDLAPLAKYIPEKKLETASKISPEVEFAQALADAGFKLDGRPVIDGKIHRVPVVDGRPGNRDGSYCAFADGHPAGWMMNYRTGAEQVKWVASGHALTTEQKAALQTQGSQQRLKRQEEIEKRHVEAGNRIFNKLKDVSCTSASVDHPYLKDKGVENHGLLQDQYGNLMLVGIDLDKSHYLNNVPQAKSAPQSPGELALHNHIQTLQTISPEGEKRFEPGAKKTGAMFLIGSDQFKKIAFDQSQPKSLLQDMESKPEILVAEGYATGASLHQATGLPVAVAFDAGNLKSVAEALNRKFPDTKLTICADNDHSSEVNVGLEKAKEAAQAVPGSKVITPDFTKEEKAKGLTDYNDLHQARGLEAVRTALAPKEAAKNTTQQVNPLPTDSPKKTKRMRL